MIDHFLLLLSALCKSGSEDLHRSEAIGVWERSFWHCTTIPVGRCVILTAESVLLTCWPPAPPDLRIDAEVGRVDRDLRIVFNAGHHVD